MKKIQKIREKKIISTPIWAKRGQFSMTRYACMINDQLAPSQPSPKMASLKSNYRNLQYIEFINLSLKIFNIDSLLN